MKLFVSRKKLIGKTKNVENVPSLEVVEVVLIQCNLLFNQYQQTSRVLYTFTPNKSYAYLLNVEPSNLVFLNLNFELNFLNLNFVFEIIITFMDQNVRLRNRRLS